MTRHQVAVLALDVVVAFDLGTAARSCSAARSTAAGEPLYDVRVATADGGPVRTSAGYRVLPDHDASICWHAPTR